METTTAAATIDASPARLRRPWRGRLLALAALAVLARATPVHGQLPAPPASARGPLRVGGYGTVVFGLTPAGAATPGSPAGVSGATGGTAPAGSTPATAPASDRAGIVGSAAALLASGTLGRLGYMGEIDAASRTWENWPGRRDDRAVEVARLYAEISAGDALRLRAGRFLTPIGQWNELHADPLTWTTQRPLTTYRPFAKSVTGAMLAGEVNVAGHDAGYAVFAAPFGPVDGGQETAFVRGVGGRVAVELVHGLFVGASTARFRASWAYSADEDSVPEGTSENGAGADASVLRAAALPRASLEASTPASEREQDTSARRLFGADVSWTIGRAELLAEGIAISGDVGHPAERGGFAQAALPILPPLFLVLRTESYDPVVHEPLRVQTVGAVLRPGGHLSIKLERQFTDRASARVPTGWFASVSAIF